MADMPDKVGRYEVERRIGQGGMGVVYLARDTTLDRAVAIKALPEAVAADADRLMRFEREAKLLAALNHAHIAAIYGLEQGDGGEPYLVLEYVEGETLEERMARGAMPVEEALGIARQIAEAAESAHHRGIVHRDLKPANMKVTVDDDVKVLDFGLAKALADDSMSDSDVSTSPTVINSPTMPGVILGTAGYLSPEQARGRRADERCDVWALGVMLYEMLTGARAFPGESVTDSLGATIHAEPSWDDLPADTPPSIRLLLRRCLTKDPRRRLQSMGDTRVQLEEALADPTSSSMLGIAASGLIGSRDSASSRGCRSTPAGTASRAATPGSRAGATTAGCCTSSSARRCTR